VDIENFQSLTTYLQMRGDLADGATIEARLLTGGVSNRTVWVRLTDGRTWVLKQALGKLRVAVDWYSDPERIHREAAGMRALAKLTPPGCIPRFVFEDRELHILAMEAVPEPSVTWKTLLMAGQIEQDHVRQFGALLGTIHRAAFERAAELPTELSDCGFFESLRIEPYYAFTATQVEGCADFYARLIDETRACRLTLVHGDYSPKNVLVSGHRLVLIDHEVIHVGDPAFDLGFALTHFLSKAHHLRPYRQTFAQAALCFWNAYRQNVEGVPWVEPLESRAVRHTLGCLLARVAGRSPLEYLTADERLRQRHAVVAMMAQPPESIEGLHDRFLSRINQVATNA
jgi:aminoglycoside phosphotransferase (APT) family kinase protein